MPSRAAFIRVFTVAAILAALPWAGAANAQTVTVAGAAPGNLSVGAKGQANYNIPIAVPPGIAGMQPSLSLNYNGGAGNGIVGMGGSISGLSSIARCARTPAQDGQWGGIEYNDNDRFCIDGKRLVAINGVYGADGTEYRTEIDGFARIVSYGKVVSGTGVQGTSPEWFRVWTKSGRIMDFGATADSRVERVQSVAPAPETPVEVRAWAVSHIGDTAGNYLAVTYFEGMATGAHRPVQIDYTLNDAAAVTAQSAVKFLYEARPDVWQGHPDGSLTTRDQRLTTIQTWTDGALVRDYGLAYETGGATGRSRLTGVTECDAAGNCLAPHVFGWKPENAGSTSDLNLILPEGVHHYDDGEFVDVNGDGLKDFVGAVKDKGSFLEALLGLPISSYRTAWLNMGGGWEISPAHQPVFDIKVADANSPNGRQTGEFVDVNGDGLKDFVRAVRAGTNITQTTWLNTGSGWVESAAYQPPFNIYTSYKRKFEDCSNYPDDPCTAINTVYYYIREGEFTDLNGDGLADFVRAVRLQEYVTEEIFPGTGIYTSSWKTNTHRTAWINTGNGWVESPEYQPPTILRRYWTEKVETCDKDLNCTIKYIARSRLEATLSDVDGDNLPDYLKSYQIQGNLIDPPTDYRATWLNTGAGWLASAQYEAPVPLWVFKPNGAKGYHVGRLVDINGDGLVDFLQASDTNLGFLDSLLQPDGDYQHAWLNTGEGWIEDTNYKPPFVLAKMSLGFHKIYLGGKMRRLRLRAELTDVNGDGLLDAVSAQEVWLNTGRGWESNAAYKPAYVINDNNKSTGDFIDLNGDGVDDFIKHPPWDVYYQWPEGRETWLTNSSAPDQLVLVTDSLGATTSLTYALITDKTPHAVTGNPVYEKGSGAVFPVRDVQPPVQVVQEVARPDGVGGQYRMAYSYAGARMDLTGRGSLGFEFMDAMDLQTGIMTTRRYAQAFPFIGMVDYEASYIPEATGDRMISRATRTLEARSLNLGATVFPYVAQSVQEAYEPNDGPGNLPITTTTTTRTHDDYGNPTQIAVATVEQAVTPRTYSTNLVNQYTNDTVNWRLGQLNRAAATKTLPDLTSATRVTAFAYDPLTGLLVQEVLEPDLPALTLTTDYTHDVFGHVATVTVSGPDIAPRSSVTEYAAAAPNFGRFPTTVANALGHSETRSWDARHGAPASLTGPNGIATSWGYDGFGRKTLESRADGTETRWSYDLCAAQCPPGGVYAASVQSYVSATGTTAAEPYDARQVEYYDLLDRAFLSETEGFQGLATIYKDRRFNALGQLEAASRAYFAGTLDADIPLKTMTYDAFGRVETVTLANGGIETTGYDGLTTTTTNELISVFGPVLPQTRERALNALGQLATATDAAGTVIAYEYDPFGNLEKTDTGGVVISMTYDIRGGKIAMDDPDAGYVTYGYNVLGELTSQTDAKLQMATMTYDLLGRLETRTEAEGTTTWQYDSAVKTAAVGKLDRVSRTEDDYVEEPFYDFLGRPQRTEVTHGGRTETLSRTYDYAGRPASLIYPAAADGSRFQIENIYDGYGYLERVREVGGQWTTYWEATAVNAEGRVTEERLGNGVTTTRGFDAGGWIQNVSVYDGFATPLKDVEYQFDTLGNLEVRTDHWQNRYEQFRYDNLNRLFSASVFDPASVYPTSPIWERLANTDDLGNLTTKSDVGFYSYAGAGPHAVTQTGDLARGYTDYEYDLNGSMIRMSDNATAAALRNITWSSFNKPVRVQDIARGQTTDFIYGPGRSRVRQTVNQGTLFTRTIAYVGGVFERSSIAGTADKMVHYIPTGGGVVIYNKFDDGIAETDSTRYLHKDHLGSIDLITDEAGLVAERRSYDAWGRQRNPDMTEAAVEPDMAETRRGFTGHEHLDSVGLIHMNGRVYDPVLGRFLSADPYVTNPTDSQSFNRYSYVTNNPLSFTDPSGFHIGDANGNPKTTNSYDPPDNTGSHAPEGTNGGGDGGSGGGAVAGSAGSVVGGTGGGISSGAQQAAAFLAGGIDDDGSWLPDEFSINLGFVAYSWDEEFTTFEVSVGIVNDKTVYDSLTGETVEKSGSINIGVADVGTYQDKKDLEEGTHDITVNAPTSFVQDALSALGIPEDAGFNAKWNDRQMPEPNPTSGFGTSHP